MNTATPPLPLRDIHLPEPISWWPPAWGWWVVALLPLLLILSWRLYRWHQDRWRLRRAALAEWKRITQNHARNPDPRLLATELSALLRRVCLSYHPREAVAGLNGADWLRFLDQNMPTRPFSEGAGEALIHAPFEPDPRFDPEALSALCREWIRRLPPQPSHPVERYP
ncbi:MAG: DUF4381 domain-containing protein [Magnetococcales bacterium]|nr:DUF4381 domain-containing protein [Magnetococcales bacterium]